MNLTELVVFLTAFTLPITWQRLNFYLRPGSFYVTPLRTWSSIPIHHGHWGLIWIICSGMMMSFGFRNHWSIAMQGLGLGLFLDEIIPHFQMPGWGRELELKIYGESLWPTLTLAGLFALSVLVLSLRLQGY